MPKVQVVLVSYLPSWHGTFYTLGVAGLQRSDHIHYNTDEIRIIRRQSNRFNSQCCLLIKQQFSGRGTRQWRARGGLTVEEAIRSRRKGKMGRRKIAGPAFRRGSKKCNILFCQCKVLTHSKINICLLLLNRMFLQALWRCGKKEKKDSRIHHPMFSRMSFNIRKNNRRKRSCCISFPEKVPWRSL